jgi:hypothetical protein
MKSAGWLQGKLEAALQKQRHEKRHPDAVNADHLSNMNVVRAITTGPHCNRISLPHQARHRPMAGDATRVK